MSANLITIKCPRPECEYTEVEDVSRLKIARWKCRQCGVMFDLKITLPPNRETVALFRNPGEMKIVIPEGYKGPMPGEAPEPPAQDPAQQPENVTQLPPAAQK